MDGSEIKRILEALLLASEKPLELDQAREVFGPEVPAEEIAQALSALSQEYSSDNRGLRIVEVAGGFQFVTDPPLYPFVTKLTHRIRAVKLSKPALETLAIVVYRQPITRVEIEQVRGVDAAGVLDTLLRFNLVRVVGRKEAVGRPLLYGTTREFLEHFGLKNLEDLPTLEELKGMTPPPAAESSPPSGEAVSGPDAAGAAQESDKKQDGGSRSLHESEPAAQKD